MCTFIALLIIGIVFVAFASYLLGKGEAAGGVLAIFAVIFFGGAVGAVVDEIKEYKSIINYDSTKHNVVKTDTTFISNNGKIDTLITYKLTDKDFTRCKN